MRTVFLLLALIGLSGCVAQIAADVVTAPIKVASKTVDVLTTSQEEADRNRGRAMRKQEEREAKERKKEEKEARRRERDEDY
jgi:predicted Holliday junction resolvase-like endonuclease